MEKSPIGILPASRPTSEEYPCVTNNFCGQRTDLEEPLRQKAEQKAASLPAIPPTLSADEMRQIMYELRVHQIELELQNEELCRVQSELDKTRARYFDLYNMAPMGYCTLSKAGLILDANLAAAVMLELTQKDLINHPISEFILHVDQDIFYFNCSQPFENQPEGSRRSGPGNFPLSGVCELRMVKKSGGTIWVQINATASMDDENVLTCRIVMSDITQRKSAEAELMKMQKLQSLGTLAGGIAHDFNNILMGLFGNISLAKQELAPGHSAFKALADAEISMNRAIRLTQQLLTFSKGGEPLMESISLATLVEEIARFDLTGSNVKLVVSKAPDLWLAKIDKSQIQQVISSLTINARQAMPNGGHLYINLENADIHEGNIPGLQQRKYIKVTVRDEGSGIDQKIIERIFDPYFTTKQSGSGLGLATTHSIIRKHGGSIEVDSQLGKGTTFKFYLPASESLALPKIVHTGEAPMSFESSHKILVMDDEIVIRSVIPRLLSRMGCNTETVADGQQAIDLYRRALESGAAFDAVILDLTVPHGMGGEQAIKGILALDPDANVIVSSGYSDDPVMSNFKDYGFRDVLPKPYTETQLLDSLKRILK